MSLNRGRPTSTAVGKAISHSVKRAVQASTGDLSKRAVDMSIGQLVKPMIDLSLNGSSGTKKSKTAKKKEKKQKQKKTIEVSNTVKAGDKLIQLIHKVPLLPFAKSTKKNPIPKLTDHTGSRYELLGHRLLQQRIVYLAMKEFLGFTQDELETLTRRHLLNGHVYHFASQYQLEPLVYFTDLTGQGDKAMARQFRAHVGMLSATRNDVATKFVDELFGPVMKSLRIFLVQECKQALTTEEYKRLCAKK